MNSDDSRVKLKSKLADNSELSRLFASYLQDQVEKALAEAGAADDIVRVRRAQGKLAQLKTIQAQLLSVKQTAE
jgi:hypothetical protein